VAGPRRRRRRLDSLETDSANLATHFAACSFRYHQALRVFWRRLISIQSSGVLRGAEIARVCAGVTGSAHQTADPARLLLSSGQAGLTGCDDIPDYCRRPSRVLVLPNSNADPTGLGKPAVRIRIPATILLNLISPKSTVGSSNTMMPWTSMPKAAV
jgi:hypothetical protein